MSDRNKSFIKVYNSSFELDERKLSPDELFVYAYLYRMRIYRDNITVTNIDIIDEHLSYSFIKGNHTANKRGIKNILLSLRTKGYVEYMLEGEFKNSTLLIIRCKDEVGFTQIDYSMYDSFDDPIKFYIYCYVDCYGDKGRTISDDDFLNVIEYFTYYDDENMHVTSMAKSYSQSKIRKKVNEMDESRIIYKFSGDYYPSEAKKKNVQKPNVYYTRPDYEIIQLYDKFKQWKASSHNNKVDTGKMYSVNFGDLNDDSIAELVTDSSWNKTNDDPLYNGYWKRLTYDDYEIYRLCRDYNIQKKFVDKCSNIILKLIESDIAKKEFEEYENKYLEERKEIDNDKLAVT